MATGVNGMKGKEWQKEGWREERPIWMIGIVLFLLLFMVGIVEWTSPELLRKISPSCFVRKYVGMYCTGCGATRAVLLALRGHFLQSMYFNAVVMYVIIIYGIYVIRGAIYLITKGKYRYMKFRVTYVFAGLGIVVVQAVVKNIALFVYHYTWM